MVQGRSALCVPDDISSGQMIFDSTGAYYKWNYQTQHFQGLSHQTEVSLFSRTHIVRT